MVSGSVSLLERLTWIVNVVFHQGIAVITVYILTLVFTSFDVSTLLPWHAFLCTFGFMFLMTEGFGVFNKANIPTLFIDRSTKALIHGCVLGLATVCIIAGISIQIYNKSGDHFSTTHGILGLIAWIFVMLAAIFGPITAKAQSLKNIVRPVFLKLTHTLIGIIGLVLGIATLCLALKNYLVSNGDIKIATYIVVSFLILWTCVSAFKSIYNHVKNIIGA